MVARRLAQAISLPLLLQTVSAVRCMEVQTGVFAPDFSKAAIVRSNLGGLGPDTTPGPLTLRFANVGINPATGRSVDLEIANKSSAHIGLKKFKHIGLNAAMLAQINVQGPQSRIEHINSTYVDLALNFIDTELSTPVVLDIIQLTFLDFDGSGDRATECMGTRDFDSVYLAPNTELVAREDLSDGGFHELCSTTIGDADDNPAGPFVLDQQQKRRAISFIFSQTASVLVRFRVRCSCCLVHVEVALTHCWPNALFPPLRCATHGWPNHMPRCCQLGGRNFMFTGVTNMQCSSDEEEGSSDEEEGLSSSPTGLACLAFGLFLSPALLSCWRKRSSTSGWGGSSDKVELQAARDTEEPSHSLEKPFLKWFGLGMLVAQNSALFIWLRITRHTTGPGYSSAVAVLCIELGKLGVCLNAIAFTSRSPAHELYMELWQKRRETLLFAVPAICYTIQNNLLFIAAAFISAVVLQAITQTKILWTAAFSVVLIGRKFEFLDWVSFVVLILGVLAIQMNSPEAITRGITAGPSAADDELRVMGSLCAAGAASMSGFAGVFLEVMYTKKGTSLWIRNVQLAVFTLPLQTTAALQQVLSGQVVGPFDNFHFSTWVVISIQIAGGLITSLVIKYAGNMPKVFAAAVGLVFTSMISIPLFGYWDASALYWLGVLTVSTATLLFEGRNTLVKYMTFQQVNLEIDHDGTPEGVTELNDQGAARDQSTS